MLELSTPLQADPEVAAAVGREEGRQRDGVELIASENFVSPAVLDAVGVPIGGEGDTYFWADELFISSADSEAALGRLTGRHHLAFQARDRAAVEAFHKAGVAAGGKSIEDPPGLREGGNFGPMYLAYLRDPDGNKLCAFHRPG